MIKILMLRNKFLLAIRAEIIPRQSLQRVVDVGNAAAILVASYGHIFRFIYFFVFSIMSFYNTLYR